MIRFVGGGRVDVLAHRQSLRRFGVPAGGPFDPFVVELFDRLLPGPGTLTILECSGADATFHIDQPASIAFWSCAKGGRTTLALGETFKLPIGPGLRGWLAIRQEHEDPSVVTRLLSKGDSVDALRVDLPDRTIDPEWLPKVPGAIRYLPNESRHFGAQTFRVDLRMDRKGIQLNGTLGAHSLELPSAPTVPGSLQWTPSGAALLIGPDGPTIGGYPSFGTIPSVEFSKVAQLRPMVSVEFLPISLDQLLEEELAWRLIWGERLDWLSLF